MQIGLENHPSTYRGAALLLSVVFALIDQANAKYYFEAGLSIAGFIGVATREGGQ